MNMGPIDATMVEHFTCQFVAFVSARWAEYLGSDWDKIDGIVRANALRKDVFCPRPSDNTDGVYQTMASSATNGVSQEDRWHDDIRIYFDRGSSQASISSRLPHVQARLCACTETV
jgi:hypothetical protein